jgi:hypothetical protein
VTKGAGREPDRRSTGRMIFPTAIRRQAQPPLTPGQPNQQNTSLCRHRHRSPKPAGKAPCSTATNARCRFVGSRGNPQSGDRAGRDRQDQYRCRPASLGLKNQFGPFDVVGVFDRSHPPGTMPANGYGIRPWTDRLIAAGGGHPPQTSPATTCSSLAGT